MRPMRGLGLLFVSFLLAVAEDECPPLTLDPPTLVVQYGAPAKITCTATDSSYLEIGWEAPVGGTFGHSISSSPSLDWSVPSLTRWNIAPQCYINPPAGSPKLQCSKKAKVVVYDPPQEVRLESDSPPKLVEGSTLGFTCSLNSSVPFPNLTTQLTLDTFPFFYQAHESTRHVELNHSVRVDRNWNEAVVQCVAIMDLRPEGPIISKLSNPLTLDVLYGAELTCPENYTIPENSPHNLTCTVEGNPPPHITWYKDDEVVDLPENFTRRDAGLYHVIASGSLSRANSTVNIIVTYPPSDILELEDSEVEVGSSVQLKCSSKANPRPQYFWSYYQSDNVREVHEDGVSLLLVENATMFNAGVYVCRAENSQGSVSHSAILTVKGGQMECPLQFVPEILVVRHGEEGHSVRCRPTSGSSANLQALFWELRPGLFRRSQDLSTVPIGLSDPKPVCHAVFRGIGPCSRSFNLTLFRTPDRVSISSVATNDSSGLPLITLSCDIANVAPARSLMVLWFHGNETLQPGHMAGGVQLGVSGCEGNSSGECSLDTSAPVNVSATVQLHLERTLDLAAVRCGAMLDLGLPNPSETMVSDPLNISLYYKPVINTTKLPKSVPVFQGYPEDLVCDADGNPRPTVRWQHSSEKVTQVNWRTIRVTEPGVYNCSASNFLGSAHHLVHVVLKEDYLPLIAGLVALTVVIISIIFVFIYSIYYTNTKMRRYSLKNPKLNSHNGNVAHNGWDLPLPMTKLS